MRVWIVALLTEGSKHAAAAFVLSPSSIKTTTTTTTAIATTMNTTVLHNRQQYHLSLHVSSVLSRCPHVLLRMVANTDNIDDGDAAAAALLAKEYELIELMVAHTDF